MKKTFLSLFFMLLVGGLFAQMPVILESDLQKLKEEAVTKSQSEKSSRSRSKSSDDEEQTTVQDQPAQNNNAADLSNQLSKIATQSTITKNGVKTTTTTTTPADNNASKSGSVNKFRDRQRRLKGK